jgi:hypothetical protein
MKVKKDEGFKLSTKKTINVMSMAEFKAWLEGFSECFKTGAPNKAQWKRIEERLGAVSIQQEIVYRDRPSWWGPYWNENWKYSSPTTITPRFPNRTNITWTANSSNTPFTNLISAATVIGQEEAKEFTV